MSPPHTHTHKKKDQIQKLQTHSTSRVNSHMWQFWSLWNLFAWKWGVSSTIRIMPLAKRASYFLNSFLNLRGYRTEKKPMGTHVTGMSVYSKPKWLGHLSWYDIKQINKTNFQTSSFTKCDTLESRAWYLDELQ